MKYEVKTRLENSMVTETIGTLDFCLGYVYAKITMLNTLGDFKMVFETSTKKIMRSETTNTEIAIEIIPYIEK